MACTLLPFFVLPDTGDGPSSIAPITFAHPQGCVLVFHPTGTPPRRRPLSLGVRAPPPAPPPSARVAPLVGRPRTRAPAAECGGGYGGGDGSPRRAGGGGSWGGGGCPLRGDAAEQPLGRARGGCWGFRGGGGGAAAAGGAPPPPALPRVLRIVGRKACCDGWKGIWGEAWRGGWKSIDGPP
ncbi:hypothetical protein BU14_0383s0002 [Porphyra umbilicalis]|uniref:Uncharacterized protein n=1 Tax=Porphyra umbilicalis TaxID=2786 RepID=A0A1X6NWQ0_PORUM|nr:hypothetical protein BU14_0383s0002 [Porphyra umbilicalis]|eukprot:OSX73028.1 hypothetical protein BU14_0383s0002 [Porphyra umbilicalis]